MPAMFKRWSGLAFVGPEAGRVWLSLCLPRVKMKEARLQGIHRVFCAFPRWFPRWSEDFSLFEKESKMRRGRWMIYELEGGGEEVIFLARKGMEKWMGGTLGVGVGNCWESRLRSSCYCTTFIRSIDSNPSFPIFLFSFFQDCARYLGIFYYN